MWHVGAMLLLDSACSRSTLSVLLARNVRVLVHILKPKHSLCCESRMTQHMPGFTLTARNLAKVAKCYLTRLALLTIFMQVTQTVLACELSSVWETFKPYQYLDNHGKLTGLDIDLLNKVASVAGCKIKFYSVPWKRGLALLKEGKVDIVSGASKTPERSLYANASSPYRYETMSIFIRQQDAVKWAFKSLNELATSSAQLGIVLGYSYGDEFERLRSKKAFGDNLFEVLNDNQNIQKLSIGRVDAILIEPIVGNGLVKKLAKASPNIMALPLRIKTGGIHFLFSKKTVKQDLIKKFNDAILLLKEAGLDKKITDKYLGSPAIN